MKHHQDLKDFQKHKDKKLRDVSYLLTKDDATRAIISRVCEFKKIKIMEEIY